MNDLERRLNQVLLEGDNSERIDLDSTLHPDWRDENNYLAAGEPASFPATVHYYYEYIPFERQTSDCPGESEGYIVEVTNIIMDDGRDLLNLPGEPKEEPQVIPGKNDPLPDTDVFSTMDEYKAELRQWIKDFEEKTAESLLNNRHSDY